MDAHSGIGLYVSGQEKQPSTSPAPDAHAVPELKETKITGTGSLTVSENAIGVVLDKGPLSLEGDLNLNLKDGAVGFVVKNGTINYNGHQIILNGVTENNASKPAILAYYENATTWQPLSYKLADNPAPLNWVEYAFKKSTLTNNSEVKSSAPIVFSLDNQSNFINNNQITLSGEKAKAIFAINSGTVNNTQNLSLDTTVANAAIAIIKPRVKTDSEAAEPTATFTNNQSGSITVKNHGIGLIVEGTANASTPNAIVKNNGTINAQGNAIGAYLRGSKFNATLAGQIKTDKIGLILDDVGAGQINTVDTGDRPTNKIVATSNNAIGIYATGSNIDFATVVTAEKKAQASSTTAGGATPTAGAEESQNNLEGIIGIYSAGDRDSTFTGSVSVKANKSIGFYLNNPLQAMGQKESNGTTSHIPTITIVGKDSIGLYTPISYTVKNTNIEANSGAIGVYANISTNTDKTLTLGEGSHISVNDEKSLGVAVAEGVSLTLGEKKEDNTIKPAKMTINEGTGIFAKDVTTINGLEVEFGDKGGLAIYGENTNLDLSNITVVKGKGQLIQGKNLGLTINQLPATSVGKKETGFSLLYSGDDANAPTEGRKVSFGDVINLTLNGQSTGIALTRESTYTPQLTFEFNGTIHSNSKETASTTGSTDTTPKAEPTENNIGLYIDNVNTLTLNEKANIALGPQGIGVYYTNGSNNFSLSNHGTIVLDHKGGVGFVFEKTNLPSSVALGTITGKGPDTVGVEFLNGLDTLVTTAFSNNSSDKSSINLSGKNTKAFFVQGGNYSLSGINTKLSGDDTLGIYIAAPATQEQPTTAAASTANPTSTGATASPSQPTATSVTLTGNNTFDISKGTVFYIKGNAESADKATLTLGDSFKGTFSESTETLATVVDQGKLIVNTDVTAAIKTTKTDTVDRLNKGIGLIVQNGAVQVADSKSLTLNVQSEKGVGAYLNNADTSGTIKVDLQGKDQVGAYLTGTLKSVPQVNASAASSPTYYIVDKVTTVAQDFSFPTIELNVDNSIGLSTKKLPDGEAAPATPITLTTSGITITGNNSIGIYNQGPYSIKNVGALRVNDATKDNKRNIGIYSQGGVITQKGDISVGKNSIGIYSEYEPKPVTEAVTTPPVPSTITVTGDMTVEPEGVGLYTDKTGTVTFTGSITAKGDTSENSTTKGGTGIYLTKAKLNLSIPTTGNKHNQLTVGPKAKGIVLTSKETSSIAFTETDIAAGGIGVYLENAAGEVATDSDNLTTVNLGLTKIGEQGYGVIVKNRPNVTITMNTDDNHSFAPYVTAAYITGKNAQDIRVQGNFTAPATIPNPNDPNDVSGHKLGIGILGDDKADIKIDAGTTITVNNPFSVGAVLVNGANLTLAEDATMNVSNGGYGVVVNDKDSTFTNNGTINVKDANSLGVALYKGTLVNEGTINISNGASGVFQGSDATPVSSDDQNRIKATADAGDKVLESEAAKPIQWGNIIIDKEGKVTIGGNVINAGAIVVAGKDLQLKNVAIDIRNRFLNPERTEVINKPFFEADQIKGNARILPSFTQGNNVTVFNTENLFKETNAAGETTGTIAFNGSVYSDSVSWMAKISYKHNEDGSTTRGLTMVKVPYKDLLTGSKNYEILGEGLDKLYASAPVTSLTGKVFDAIDMINNDDKFARQIAELRGDLYANIQDRVQGISNVFKRGQDFLASQMPLSRHTYKMTLLGEKNDHDDTLARATWDVKHTGVLLSDERGLLSRNGRTVNAELGFLYSDFGFANPANKDAREKVHSLHLGLGYVEPLQQKDNGEFNLKLHTSLDVERHHIKRPITAGANVFDNENTLYAYNWISDIGLQYKRHWSAITLLAGTGLEARLMRINSGDETGAVPLRFEGKNYKDVLPYIEAGALWGKPLNVDWNLQAKLGAKVSYSTQKPFDARNRVSLLGTSQTYELPGTHTKGINKTVSGYLLLAQRKGFTASVLGSIDTHHDHSFGLQMGFKW